MKSFLRILLANFNSHQQLFLSLFLFFFLNVDQINPIRLLLDIEIITLSILSIQIESTPKVPGFQTILLFLIAVQENDAKHLMAFRHCHLSVE